MQPMTEKRKKVLGLIVGCCLGAVIGLMIGSGYMVFFSFVAGLAGLVTLTVRGEL